MALILELALASLCWIRDVFWLEPAAPKVLGSGSKTHLEFRCCLLLHFASHFDNTCGSLDPGICTCHKARVVSPPPSCESICVAVATPSVTSLLPASSPSIGGCLHAPCARNEQERVGRHRCREQLNVSNFTTYTRNIVVIQLVITGPLTICPSWYGCFTQATRSWLLSSCASPLCSAMASTHVVSVALSAGMLLMLTMRNHANGIAPFVYMFWASPAAASTAAPSPSPVLPGV